MYFFSFNGVKTQTGLCLFGAGLGGEGGEDFLVTRVKKLVETKTQNTVSWPFKQG